MSRERLQMMSNDERLTAHEVEWVVKHYLAKALGKKQKPVLRPSVSESQFRVKPLVQHRSFSPKPTNSMGEVYPAEPLTPSILTTEGSSDDDRFQSRDRSATNAVDHPRPSLSSRSQCNPYTDSPYEYEIIETAFGKLFDRLKDTDGVRRSLEGQAEVHVNNVKQFFLESYVNSQTSLNAMMSPFKAAKWIDARSFTLSMESIQQISYDHSFFNKDELATTKNNLIRQKLLCMFHPVFFKLLDYNQRNALSKFEVKTISGMALRSRKKISSENLDMVVQRAFEKANEMRAFSSDFISFEEFVAVLKN